MLPQVTDRQDHAATTDPYFHHQHTQPHHLNSLDESLLPPSKRRRPDPGHQTQLQPNVWHFPEMTSTASGLCAVSARSNRSSPTVGNIYDDPSSHDLSGSAGDLNSLMSTVDMHPFDHSSVSSVHSSSSSATVPNSSSSSSVPSSTDPSHYQNYPTHLAHENTVATQYQPVEVQQYQQIPTLQQTPSPQLHHTHQSHHHQNHHLPPPQLLPTSHSTPDPEKDPEQIPSERYNLTTYLPFFLQSQDTQLNGYPNSIGHSSSTSNQQGLMTFETIHSIIRSEEEEMLDIQRLGRVQLNGRIEMFTCKEFTLIDQLKALYQCNHCYGKVVYGPNTRFMSHLLNCPLAPAPIIQQCREMGVYDMINMNDMPFIIFTSLTFGSLQPFEVLKSPVARSLIFSLKLPLETFASPAVLSYFFSRIQAWHDDLFLKYFTKPTRLTLRVEGWAEWNSKYLYIVTATTSTGKSFFVSAFVLDSQLVQAFAPEMNKILRFLQQNPNIFIVGIVTDGFVNLEMLLSSSIQFRKSPYTPLLSTPVTLNFSHLLNLMTESICESEQFKEVFDKIMEICYTFPNRYRTVEQFSGGKYSKIPSYKSPKMPIKVYSVAAVLAKVPHFLKHFANEEVMQCLKEKTFFHEIETLVAIFKEISTCLCNSEHDLFRLSDGVVLLVQLMAHVEAIVSASKLYPDQKTVVLVGLKRAFAEWCNQDMVLETLYLDVRYNVQFTPVSLAYIKNNIKTYLPVNINNNNSSSSSSTNNSSSNSSNSKTGNNADGLKQITAELAAFKTAPYTISSIDILEHWNMLAGAGFPQLASVATLLLSVLGNSISYELNHAQRVRFSEPLKSATDIDAVAPAFQAHQIAELMEQDEQCMDTRKHPALRKFVDLCHEHRAEEETAEMNRRSPYPPSYEETSFNVSWEYARFLSQEYKTLDTKPPAVEFSFRNCADNGKVIFGLSEKSISETILTVIDYSSYQRIVNSTK
ncbi:uncharacterized protein SAPINGB_P004508 [Magnusiomyces paraingens]|uniref:Uncharacterized protein n=1 Tax=Magnusiomyces paraingens TaxID=2606893 RepID=A0A5E8BUU2_9ASCO|nr:uncharacterized protein SAPINGB_P004508 [Saprochaete ingens]VVT55262.1 unnamed protein product [Saprochaete ingens]